MDSKGYIPISLLASFNRIKQLTLDTRLVKEVLLLSAFVEVNGGMVRMGGVGGGAAAASSGSVSSGGNESQQIRSSSSWESFVLPDAVESVVEDVAMENVGVDNSFGGYHQQQQQPQPQLNGYGYGGGTGYGYGYGAGGYGYGYGYGYPPVGPTAGSAGLGYYEDPQSQLQQQQQQQPPSGGGGYGPGDGAVDEHEQASSETVLPSMLMNGHTAESTTSTNTTRTRKLDNPPTSAFHSKEKKGEEIKLNGIFKHDQQQHGDGGGEEYGGDDGEEEEEDEEEDVVFVMGGTDVSTSWAPERQRRA